jgi:hypothetical protein
VMMISMNEDSKYLHELLIRPVSATHEAWGQTDTHSTWGALSIFFCWGPSTNLNVVIWIRLRFEWHLCRVKSQHGAILKMRDLGWGDSWVQPHILGISPTCGLDPLYSTRQRLS